MGTRTAQTPPTYTAEEIAAAWWIIEYADNLRPAVAVESWQELPGGTKEIWYAKVRRLIARGIIIPGTRKRLRRTA